MKKGFTLIELLIVIAIIALLTGIILTSLSGSKAKSRDAKRASDLAQIQLSIEQYFGRCDQYPASLPSDPLGLTLVTNGCPPGVSMANFISQIPKDPTTNLVYDYMINNSTPTDYLLHATFETVNAASPQSAPLPSLTNWIVGSGSAITVCDNQKNYCIRPN